jgi:hypothetical protein
MKLKTAKEAVKGAAQTITSCGALPPSHLDVSTEMIRHYDSNNQPTSEV